VEKSISSSLTCGKCGQKKVSYSQAQTRSADEPMTVSDKFRVGRGEGREWKANVCIDVLRVYGVWESVEVQLRGMRCGH